MKPVTTTIWCSICLFAFALLFTVAHAGGPEKQGFYGHIIAGTFYTDGEMSLDDASEDDNARITSLNQASPDQSEFSAFLGGQLNYGFADTGTVVSLGFEGMPKLSLMQPVSGTGEFTLSVGYMEDDAWADPFLTTASRAVVDRETWVYGLEWDNIMDTRFRTGYHLTSVDLDNDTAGRRNAALKRDGEIHSLSFGHQCLESSPHSFGADLILEIGDMSGNAHSYNGYGVELVHTFQADTWKLETGLGIITRDYDSNHPEFGKTREDTEFEVSTMFTLFNLFNQEEMFLMLYGGYGRNNSNINFYDSAPITIGTGIGYTF